MAQGKSDNALEIADMNARLSKVHIELKDVFRYIWVSMLLVTLRKELLISFILPKPETVFS